MKSFVFIQLAFMCDVCRQVAWLFTCNSNTLLLYIICKLERTISMLNFSFECNETSEFQKKKKQQQNKKFNRFPSTD